MLHLSMHAWRTRNKKAGGEVLLAPVGVIVRYVGYPCVCQRKLDTARGRRQIARGGRSSFASCLPRPPSFCKRTNGEGMKRVCGYPRATSRKQQNEISIGAPDMVLAACREEWNSKSSEKYSKRANKRRSSQPTLFTWSCVTQVERVLSLVHTYACTFRGRP